MIKLLFLLFSLVFLLNACQTEAIIKQEHIRNIAQVWAYESGAPLNLPPVRAGEVVVVVPQGGRALGIELATGKLLWSFGEPGKVWERAVASNGQLIFLSIPGGEIIALDARTGKQRWSQELGIEAQAPPLLAGGTLYIATTFVGPGLAANPAGRARIYALDPAHGKIKWFFESENYILQTPCLDGDTLYVAGSYSAPELNVEEGGPARLYALNAVDGSLRWVNENLDGYVKGIYAASGRVAYIAYQDFLVGLDSVDGKPLWRLDTGNWVPHLSGSDGIVYFGSANTVVHAVDIVSGQHQWEYNIPEGTFNYVLGSPVKVLDELIFLTQQGEVIALNAQDGELLWSHPTGLTARVGLSVSGEWLFLGDQDGKVLAFRSQP